MKLVSLNKIFAVALFLVLSSLLSGCASVGSYWKSLISDTPDEATKQKSKIQGASFNQQSNLAPTTYRKYKRTKRSDLENEAQLESKAGSLWVMEGQGAYLFSQNTIRMIGDPVAIRIEGDPADQLSSKAGVIGKLLAQIEDRRKRALGRGPTAEKKGEKAADPAAAGQPQTQSLTSAPTGGPDQVPPTSTPDGKTDFNVKSVPTRVVERLVDGNYRVRGTQPFMIGNREYKVIVSGIVRSEDFNEEGISASQLLDSNFDIVSAKGAELR